MCVVFTVSVICLSFWHCLANCSIVSLLFVSWLLLILGVVMVLCLLECGFELWLLSKLWQVWQSTVLLSGLLHIIVTLCFNTHNVPWSFVNVILVSSLGFQHFYSRSTQEPFLPFSWCKIQMIVVPTHHCVLFLFWIVVLGHEGSLCITLHADLFRSCDLQLFLWGSECWDSFPIKVPCYVDVFALNTHWVVWPIPVAAFSNFSFGYKIRVMIHEFL